MSHRWKTKQFILKRILKDANHCMRCYSSNFNTQRRRVVCTGIGTVNPLGVGAQQSWKNLLAGKTGVNYNNKPGFEEIPSKVAAFIPHGTGPNEFDISKHASKSERKYLSDSMIYALVAAEEALCDAQWHPSSDVEKQRTGVSIGAGMVDLETIAETHATFHSRGYRRVSPYFVPKILINLNAGHVSMRYGFQGPNLAQSTACTTGAHSIGDAMRLIRNGDADVMVCGSTDAALIPVSLAGFGRARALSTSFTDTPQASSRPFDKHRDGFVAGEGAGILVLEELEHARSRGANIYAEILGYGMSGDAHHMTAPREDGTGAFLCMQACLRDASISPEAVQYVNAHATSTPIGDRVENIAIKRCFGSHAYNMQISSSKGAIGHLLGAAGSVESIFTVLAVHHGVAPPTLNCNELEDEFDLNYVRGEKQIITTGSGPRIAVKNSFGFGGTNASLCFREFSDT